MLELDEVKLVEMRWRAAPAQLEFFVSGQTRKPLELNHLADQLITALADHTTAPATSRGQRPFNSDLISSLSLSEPAVAGGGFRSGSGSGGVRAGVLLDQDCELCGTSYQEPSTSIASSSEAAPSGSTLPP